MSRAARLGAEAASRGSRDRSSGGTDMCTVGHCAGAATAADSHHRDVVLGNHEKVAASRA